MAFKEGDGVEGSSTRALVWVAGRLKSKLSCQASGIVMGVTE